MSLEISQYTFDPINNPSFMAGLRKLVVSVEQHFDFSCKCGGGCNKNLIADMIFHLEIFGSCLVNNRGFVQPPTKNRGKLYEIRNPLPSLSKLGWQNLFSAQETILGRILQLINNPGFHGMISLGNGSSFFDKQKLINKLKEGGIAVLEQDFKAHETKQIDIADCLCALRDYEQKILQNLGIPPALMRINLTHSNHESAMRELEQTSKTKAKLLYRWIRQIDLLCMPELVKQSPEETPQESKKIISNPEEITSKPTVEIENSAENQMN
jgi:hypothetical protein